jgi:chromosome segregation ATPase
MNRLTEREITVQEGMDNLIQQQLKELHVLEVEEAKKLKAIQEELNTLCSELSNKENVLVQKNRQKRSLIATNFKLQVEVDDMEQALANCESKYCRVKNQLVQLYRTINELKVRTKQHQLEVDDQRKEHESYLQKIKTFFESDSEYGKRLKEIERQIEQQKEEIKIKEEELETENTLFNQLHEQLTTLEKEHQSLLSEKMEMTKNIRQMTSSMDPLKSKSKQLRRNIEQKKREIKRFEQEYTQQQEFLQTLEEQIVEQESKISKVEQLKCRVLKEYEVQENKLRSVQRKKQIAYQEMQI